MENKNDLFEKFKEFVEKRVEEIGKKYNNNHELPPMIIPFLDGHLEIIRKIILGIAVLDGNHSVYITHDEPLKNAEGRDLTKEKVKINQFIPVPFNTMYTIDITFETNLGDEEEYPIPIHLTCEERNHVDNYICYYEGKNIIYQTMGWGVVEDFKQFLLDVVDTNIIRRLYDDYGEDYVRSLIIKKSNIIE